MVTPVRVDEVGPVPLAAVRRTASRSELSRVVPEACGVVWNDLRSNQVSGAGCHVAVYLDCVMNLEIGVEMDGPFAGIGEVVGTATPAGRVATATHFGPYDRLNEAHEAVHAHCAANGLELAGPSWEVYGHWTDECNTDPMKIRTDVFYLLKD